MKNIKFSLRKCWSFLLLAVILGLGGCSQPQKSQSPAEGRAPAPPEENVIYLAGGCFWGLQKFLDQFDGVSETEVGYANGPEESTHPSYEDVCNNSGHAETVRVMFDENVLPLEKLLEYYFMVIDPLSVNRQGHDTGIQYRTGIYYTDLSMEPVISEYCSRVSDKIGSPLAVEVIPLDNFYSAEEYHQKYLDKKPHGYCHIPAGYMHISEKE